MSFVGIVEGGGQCGLFSVINVLGKYGEVLTDFAVFVERG